MRKIVILSPGVTQLIEAPIPQVTSPLETLVKVEAAGLNRIDLLTIDGTTRTTSQVETPGVELFGTEVQTGRKVMALVPQGAFAEYVVCPRDGLVECNLNLRSEQIAALPEALAVCQKALVNFLKPTEERPILIHGGSSGIGSFLIQVAKKFTKNVVTTVGDDNKKEFCKQYGINHVLNYRTESYDKLCQELGGAYHVIDILGGQYFDKTIASLGQQGSIMIMAVMNGNIANINLAGLLMKNLHIEGMTLKDKSPSYKSELISNAMNLLGADLNNGTIEIPLDVYSFDDHDIALDKMRRRDNRGKIVLKF